MSDSQPSRWTTAATGVRAAASWLATVVGAGATLVFGAGPLFKGDVDASQWSTSKWIWVTVLVAVGAAAACYVVARLLKLQVPVEVSLSNLPASLQRRIDKNYLGEYLPGDTKDLQDFKDRLRGFTNAAAKLRAAADAEKDPVLQADLKRLAAIQEANRDAYRDRREQLYAEAAYEIEADRLTPRRNWEWLSLLAAVVLVTVTMALYSFAIGSKAKPDEKAASSNPPAMGQFFANPRVRHVLRSLGLEACEIDGIVPIVVLSEEEGAYQVETTGSPRGCPRVRMKVPRNVITVMEIEPVTIDWVIPGAKSH